MLAAKPRPNESTALVHLLNDDSPKQLAADSVHRRSSSRSFYRSGRSSRSRVTIHGLGSNVAAHGAD